MNTCEYSIVLTENTDIISTGILQEVSPARIRKAHSDLTAVVIQNHLWSCTCNIPFAGRILRIGAFHPILWLWNHSLDIGKYGSSWTQSKWSQLFNPSGWIPSDLSVQTSRNDTSHGWCWDALGAWQVEDGMLFCMVRWNWPFKAWNYLFFRLQPNLVMK